MSKTKRTEKYPIEKAIERFFDRAGEYLFVRKKTKEERMAHTMELIAWLFLTAAIILRVGKL